MKTSNFHNDLGVTTACMKRLSISTKWCIQMTSNDTSFSDRWFSFVKTDKDMAATGVNYCRPVKTSQKVFPFEYVRKVDERLAVRFISCYEE